MYSASILIYRTERQKKWGTIPKKELQKSGDHRIQVEEKTKKMLTSVYNRCTVKKNSIKNAITQIRWRRTKRIPGTGFLLDLCVEIIRLTIGRN